MRRIASVTNSKGVEKSENGGLVAADGPQIDGRTVHVRQFEAFLAPPGSKSPLGPAQVARRARRCRGGGEIRNGGLVAADGLQID